MTPISSLGEFGLIDRIVSAFPIAQASTLTGPGDDAAVIQYQEGKVTVISTDLLTEGIHFDLIYTPLKHLGYKSVVVNLSDIYAMNATPKQITVSIALSSRFTVEAVDDLFEGIKAACERFGVDLIGGDTTSSLKGLTISITAIGEGDPKLLTYRKGAKPGDLLCVTGDLGAAYCGLQLLEREKRIYLEHPNVQPNLESKEYTIGRQLKPEPREDMIKLFASAGLVPTAMIDVSDGLASEVLHLCKASGVGALVEEALLPVHSETYDMALAFQIDPTTVALHGGEDYELLFTIDAKDVDKIRFMMDVKIIGEIVEASEGTRLQTKGGNFHPLTAQGFNHFTEE